VPVSIHKSETRTPKPDPLRRRDRAARGNPKAEIRNHSYLIGRRHLPDQAAFGFRISAFGFQLGPRPCLRLVIPV
jgi:hypothetical protein